MTHSSLHSVLLQCHNKVSNYSVIIDWAESNVDCLNKSSRLDHFKKADMSATRFEELSLRLGYPYLYTHHGNCEHGLMFTDLRYSLSYHMLCLYNIHKTQQSLSLSISLSFSLFLSLRLLNPSDIQDRRRYPLLYHYARTYRKRCCICDEFTARLVGWLAQMLYTPPTYMFYM